MLTDITLGGHTYKNVTLEFSEYSNGRVAILLNNLDGALEKSTVNMSDDDVCGDNECYIKEWSENAGMTQWLIDNDIIMPEILGSAKSGHVVAHRYALTEASIAKAFRRK